MLSTGKFLCLYLFFNVDHEIILCLQRVCIAKISHELVENSVLQGYGHTLL